MNTYTETKHYYAKKQNGVWWYYEKTTHRTVGYSTRKEDIIRAMKRKEQYYENQKQFNYS